MCPSWGMQELLDLLKEIKNMQDGGKCLDLNNRPRTGMEGVILWVPLKLHIEHSV